MKLYISSAVNSYSKILKVIEKELLNDGKIAKVNLSDRCVDVFDDEGAVIEQHYPVIYDEVQSSRGKFEYVGPGNGDYICTQTEYIKKRYTEKGHRIKKVSDVLHSV